MWSLKYNTNEHIYETETDSTNSEQIWDCMDGGGVGERWTGNLGLADANYYVWDG